jgi:broad specificity phosphatase PhoE
MELYILRHGQTDYNLARRLQGRKNTMLNATGIAQAGYAACIAASLGLKFDHIYCSPLERAEKTCEIFSGMPRSSFIIDDRLAEIDFGGIEGMQYDELPEAQKAVFTAPDRYMPVGGGESIGQLMDRVTGFLRDVADPDSNDRVLVTSHGTAIHAMLLYIMHRPVSMLWDEPVGNCSVHIVGTKGGKLIHEGRF